MLLSNEAIEELSLKIRIPISIAKITIKYGKERKAKEGRMVKEERIVKEVDKAKKA